MRYKTDANGYITEVFFGCYGNGCKEYTGTIPNGYTDLNDWSTNALINAYYIDEDGNLILDADRLADLEDKIELDTIDNTPVLHKDLYGTNNVLDTQYQKATATGEVIEITDVKKINPKVTFTNIECYKFSKLDIVTQGRQMLDNNAKTETINGVTFTKRIDGSILINGTATGTIEYNLCGGSDNTSPIFALKKNLDYYLNLGGLSCSMKYYDGETTGIVYEGVDGVINISENKMVTQVTLSIATGDTFSNKVIYPMLNYGSTAYEYEEYKAKLLTLDFNEFIEEGLFPAEDLFPADDLYPSGTKIEYIHIEDGKVYISVDGVEKYLIIGNVNLFDGYNLVYTMQETNIEMEYCINLLSVDDLEFMQGKATTTNKFKILEDGSIEAHNGYFSGTVNATDGSFTGTINAEDGSFNGTVTSTEGNIGGWDLNETGLSNGNYYIRKNGYSNIYVISDIIICQMMITGTIQKPEAGTPLFKHYDVNNDGVINLQDYVLIQSMILEIN